MSTTSHALSIAGLETVYDTLATAIDQAGRRNPSCFWSSWRC